jgi:glutamate 5-kinase
VEGQFARGDLVICRAPDGRRILGARREELLQRLGYPGEPELVHRDNLVLTAAG